MVTDRRNRRKKVKKPPAKKLSVERWMETGTVHVSLGVRLSANYQSTAFDVGATLPIGPDEDPKNALGRVEKLVADFFDDRQGPNLDRLDEVVQDRRAKKR